MLVRKFFLTLILAYIGSPVFAQVIDIPHQQDAATRTLLFTAPNPKALVLLFPGGGGMMRLQDDGSTKNRHTFIRSVDQWSQYHIDAVLVDTPYDLGDYRRGDLRGRPDHLERVAEVAAYYKDKFGEIATYLGSSSNESKQIHDASAGYKIYDNTKELNQYLDGIKMILQNADRQVNLRYKK